MIEKKPLPQTPPAVRQYRQNRRRQESAPQILSTSSVPPNTSTSSPSSAATDGTQLNVQCNNNPLSRPAQPRAATTLCVPNPSGLPLRTASPLRNNEPRNVQQQPSQRSIPQRSLPPIPTTQRITPVPSHRPPPPTLPPASPPMLPPRGPAASPDKRRHQRQLSPSPSSSSSQSASGPMRSAAVDSRPPSCERTTAKTGRTLDGIVSPVRNVSPSSSRSSREDSMYSSDKRTKSITSPLRKDPSSSSPSVNSGHTTATPHLKDTLPSCLPPSLPERGPERDPSRVRSGSAPRLRLARTDYVGAPPRKAGSAIGKREGSSCVTRTPAHSPLQRGASMALPSLPPRSDSTEYTTITGCSSRSRLPRGAEIKRYQSSDDVIGSNNDHTGRKMSITEMKSISDDARGQLVEKLRSKAGTPTDDVKNAGRRCAA